jgi:hypothetical protein
MENRTYRIGRFAANGVVEHAFDIRRRDDGGIVLLNITKLSDQERFLLFSHFGSPMTDLCGKIEEGKAMTMVTTEKPGAPLHFVRAVCQIPSPFTRMPPKE